jgi:hypothetical protein
MWPRLLPTLFDLPLSHAPTGWWLVTHIFLLDGSRVLKKVIQPLQIQIFTENNKYKNMDSYSGKSLSHQNAFVLRLPFLLNFINEAYL